MRNPDIALFFQSLDLLLYLSFWIVWFGIKVIFIEVPFDITLQRVKNRGREKGELLDERIERAKTHQSFPDADFTVDNSGALEEAIDQFLNYVLETVK